MNAPILADFETRSRAPLKEWGPRKYAAHASTIALCCAWFDLESRSAGVWFPGERWPHQGRQLAFQNAKGFDRHIAARYGIKSRGGFLDTSEAARRMGLPGALEVLGDWIAGIPKDTIASRYTKALSQIKRPPKAHPLHIPQDEWSRLTADEKRRRGIQTEITPAVLDRVVPYCCRDVEVLVAAWPELEPWIDVEADVSAVDTIVNDRGIVFDVDLADRLLECDERLTDLALRGAAKELGWSVAKVRETVSSNPKFCAATGAPNMQAETVKKLDHPLAAARQAMGSIVRSKLTAGLDLVGPDGRLRDMLKAYEARTWRWTGKGFQPHNLNRPHKDFEEWTPEQTDDLAERVLTGKHWATAKEIDFLLRPVLRAKDGFTLAVSDYSGVEARALAWCAGDPVALATFASGKDPYKVAAQAIFGLEYDAVEKHHRQIGKIAELALGYQGGPGAFQKFADGMGIDLSAINVPKAVTAWRENRGPTVAYWRRLGRAWERALGGKATRVWPFDVVPSDNGRDVAIFMPSGRPIVYPFAGFYRVSAVFGGKEATKFSLGYRVGPGDKTPWKDEYGYKISLVYGGLLTENVIQGFCRDLLATALVKAERVGLRPVLHVHDEIACEVPIYAGAEGLRLLKHVMCDLPEWAEGFPIGASGDLGRRYRK